jgi:hypothetical protein
MVAILAGPEALSLKATTNATVALRAGGGEETIPAGRAAKPRLARPRPGLPKAASEASSQTSQ